MAGWAKKQLRAWLQRERVVTTIGCMLLIGYLGRCMGWWLWRGRAYALARHGAFLRLHHVNMLRSRRKVATC